MTNEITTSGVPFDEQYTGGSDLLTVTVNQDGIGTMVVLRSGSSFVQVHNGSSLQSRWPMEYLVEFARSVIEQL